VDAEKLNAVLKSHLLWLQGDGGSSADLSYANLSSADLRYAYLSSADLSSANLSSANLSSANLSSANLSSANLRYADLSSADLRYADLRYANLSSADLSSADLRYANLSSANLSSAKASDTDVFLRLPITISGCRFNVEEVFGKGICIGCESNITSGTLAELFEKFDTPEPMRPLYAAAVALIENYVFAHPLTGAVIGGSHG